METSNKYPGQVSSALRRARKILADAGLPKGGTVGRYHPIGGHDKVLTGVKVSRVGCSASIALSWYGPLPEGETYKSVNAKAVEALRAGGMPFEDNGWLTCEKTGD